MSDARHGDRPDPLTDAHNDEVYPTLLGPSSEQSNEQRSRGVI